MTVINLTRKQKLIFILICLQFVNGQIMTRSSMFAGSSPGVGTRSPR